MSFNAKNLADQLYDLKNEIYADTINPLIINLNSDERDQVIKALANKKSASGMTTSKQQQYWRSSGQNSSMSMDEYNDNEHRHASNPRADEVHSKCDQIISIINQCKLN